MRLAVLGLSLFGLAACDLQRIDACAELEGTCIGLQVEGENVGRVDELLAIVVIDGGPANERTSRPSQGAAAALPVAVALRLPGIAEGAVAIVDIGLVGRLEGAEVGTGSLRVEVRGGAHAYETIVLRDRSSGDGGAGDGGECLLLCPSTVACGMVDDGCGGRLDCGRCLVTSVAPTVARPGSVISIEGRLGADTVVEFPGGGTSPAQLLSANRANVVVPKCGHLEGRPTLPGHHLPGRSQAGDRCGSGGWSALRARRDGGGRQRDARYRAGPDGLDGAAPPGLLLRLARQPALFPGRPRRR
jgi:hypothetical protein